MPRLSAFVGLLLSAALPAAADEAAIIGYLEQYFRTPDPAQRKAAVEAILADPAYDRAKVRGWLHQVPLFEPLPAGQRTLRVDLPGGASRTVVLRIPRGYDPTRPWPLIYALHGMGGRAAQIIAYLEGILGEQCEAFVIAAPDGYEEVAVHDPRWPPTAEHPRAWRAIRETVHVDGDRVHLTGYSRGGHGSWTLGVLHADQFASITPIAGTLLLPLGDTLYETFVPSVANVPFLCVWGANDIHGPDGKISPDGGICGMNRKLRRFIEGRSAVTLEGKDASPPLPDATFVEFPGQGHGGIVPPAGELAAQLAARRTHYPARVAHTFRHIYQGQAYWLEGLVWYGKQWADKTPDAPMRSGESIYRDGDYRRAAGRAIRRCLAVLEGSVEKQVVRVRRKKLREVVVWFGDGMIDWARPVTLYIGSQKAFEGTLEPSLHVCLAQVARTWEFDRLRWAGLHFRRSASARPVTTDTRFPTLDDMTVPKRRQP
jgi:hypothetical protein